MTAGCFLYHNVVVQTWTQRVGLLIDRYGTVLQGRIRLKTLALTDCSAMPIPETQKSVLNFYCRESCALLTIFYFDRGPNIGHLTRIFN